jgi:hypothetical protein
LIIFLGHGRSDALYGSKADGCYSIVTDAEKREFPDRFYYNDNFISQSNNIEIFRNKKVFCLACESRGRIADLAIMHGATSYLGFGKIPTSESEFEKGTRDISSIVAKMKGELNEIIKKSLVYAIQKQFTFEELRHLIQFISRQKLVAILKHKAYPQRILLAETIYDILSEVTVKGNKNVRLLS